MRLKASTKRVTLTDEIIYLEIDTVGLFDPPVINAITELNSSTHFSVYPNPAKNTLTIDGDYTSATIYNVFGKVVLTTDYQNTIDVTDLSNGVYFININTNKGYIIKKITIAK